MLTDASAAPELRPGVEAEFTDPRDDEAPASRRRSRREREPETAGAVQ